MRTKGLPLARITLALFAGLLGLIAFLPAPRSQDFPREGNPAIANGLAGPFSGLWWIGFPEGEGMINGQPVVDCSSGVVLSAEGDGRLLYRSPSGQAVFELMEFSGRTTWLPEFGESTIAVWVNADEFFTYSVDLGTGRARWDNPLVYRRC